MRAVLAVGAVLLAAASAAPAGVRDTPREAALKVVVANTKAAISYEKVALNYARAGNRAGMAAELQSARHALSPEIQAVQILTPPAALVSSEPRKTDPWARLWEWRTEAWGDDSVAEDQPKHAIGLIDSALELKEKMLQLTTGEVKKPDCAVVTDLRGPIVVNGVPQGHSTLTVDVDCQKPIEFVLVMIPGDDMTQVGGSAPAKIDGNGAVAELDVNDLLKNVTFTMETTPDPSAGSPVDVVEIAGDSSEYFQETM
jgi:hypothetical protein